MAEERKTSLTKRDVNRVIARWYITTEMSLNYERMQSIAYTICLNSGFEKTISEQGGYDSCAAASSGAV